MVWQVGVVYRPSGWRSDSVTVWVVYRLSGWWNDSVTAWVVYRLSGWWNDSVTAWVVYRSSGWQSDSVTVWVVYRLSGWRSDSVTVWVVYGPSGWWSDSVTVWVGNWTRGCIECKLESSSVCRCACVYRCVCVNTVVCADVPMCIAVRELWHPGYWADTNHLTCRCVSDCFFSKRKSSCYESFAALTRKAAAGRKWLPSVSALHSWSTTWSTRCKSPTSRFRKGQQLASDFGRGEEVVGGGILHARQETLLLIFVVFCLVGFSVWCFDCMVQVDSAQRESQHCARVEWNHKTHILLGITTAKVSNGCLGF